jgi:hypothetical protein
MSLRDSATKLDVSTTSALIDAGACSTEFVKAAPEVCLKRWDGEAELRVSYEGVTGTLEELSREDEWVKWGSGDLHVEAYTLSAAQGMEDGGLELELVLNTKPATNVFAFKVDGAEAFDWFYQPPLTPEQIASGRHRPDNVVDSFAVYHKSKRDHRSGGINYGAGKAFHVYRPKLIDAKGVETWGALEFADGVLTVVIPQAALDDAAYPAIIDPTFGYTGTGGSTYDAPNDYLEGTRGTPGASGTVDSVSVYTESTADVKPVIVLQSTLNIVTNGVGPTTSISGAASFKTLNYSVKPSVTGGTDYYVSVLYDGVAGLRLYYDSTGPGDIEDTTNSFASPTNPTDGTEISNERLSLYATYTEAGGSPMVEDSEWTLSAAPSARSAFRAMAWQGDEEIFPLVAGDPAIQESEWFTAERQTNRSVISVW